MNHRSRIPSPESGQAILLLVVGAPLFNRRFIHMRRSSAALDFRTPCVYAQNNGFSTSSDTVTVSFPATISGVTLSSDPSPAVSVSAQRVLKNRFNPVAGAGHVHHQSQGISRNSCLRAFHMPVRSRSFGTQRFYCE